MNCRVCFISFHFALRSDIASIFPSAISTCTYLPSLLNSYCLYTILTPLFLLLFLSFFRHPVVLPFLSLFALLIDLRVETLYESVFACAHAQIIFQDFIMDARSGSCQGRSIVYPAPHPYFPPTHTHFLDVPSLSCTVFCSLYGVQVLSVPKSADLLRIGEEVNVYQTATFNCRLSRKQMAATHFMEQNKHCTGD